MLYLERGSEKSFTRFCRALESTEQSFLVNAMNVGVATQQRVSSTNEIRPVLQGSTSEESTAVSCTEPTPDETRTLPVEITTESTQGFTLYFIL